MRAKFSELTYDAGQQKSCCASKGCGQVEPWLTAEGIPVKGAYTAQDLEGMEHLNYAAGIAPFLQILCRVGALDRYLLGSQPRFGLAAAFRSAAALLLASVIC